MDKSALIQDFIGFPDLHVHNALCNIKGKKAAQLVRSHFIFGSHCKQTSVSLDEVFCVQVL